MKLKLTIHLGNAAMLTTSDVKRALIAVTNAMGRDLGDMPTLDDGGAIQDHNGNTVGRWRFLRSRKGDKE